MSINPAALLAARISTERNCVFATQLLLFKCGSGLKINHENKKEEILFILVGVSDLATGHSDGEIAVCKRNRSAFGPVLYNVVCDAYSVKIARSSLSFNFINLIK